MSHTEASASTAPQPARVDSPLAMRYIPLDFDNATPDQCALELVHELDRSWKTDDGPVEFVRFTDGITNTLLKAVKKRPGRSAAENDEEAVLLRTYGQGTAVLIDRERELRAHDLLANLGLAPALLARFNNGLMYRFISGDVCTPEDLRKPHIYRQVAKRVGQWHGSLPVSAITTSPCSSDSASPTSHAAPRPTPNIWTVMQRWISALPSATPADHDRNARLQSELTHLSSALGDLPGIGGSTYVFAHCDLLSGNVIVTNSAPDCAERPVSFIDYEYATPAPAAFDLANHFAEWAGFDCDHSAVPTRSQRRDFLIHYVTSYRQHLPVSAKLAKSVDGSYKDSSPQDDAQTMFELVDMYRGVPGFFWGIWALIQATISQIDFDYATYAELRLGEYWGWKAEADGEREKLGKKMTVRESRWAEQ